MKFDANDMLREANEFHGHVCPFLALGVRASIIAMEKLRAEKAGTEESVEEDILAIVECNNCFADGVQIATGCTFGNNSLVYFDLGKNAVTLVRRGEWEGVRVYIDANALDKKYFPEEANELFNKVVVRRQGNEEDRKELTEMWKRIGYKMLEIPEDDFKIEIVDVEPIEQAPIFKNVRCSKCDELVMETRASYIDGKPYCLRCAGKAFNAVIGRGIVEMG
ncbi:MAG: TraR/DksA C4-type zinc finger protein [Archaeoglobus sp.]|nr:TraR/DksA C4-type zinc finger protein [Archaeoglobus sp.]